MIIQLQDYIQTLCSNVTFGQIPDGENVININLVEAQRDLCFGHDVRIYNLTLYVRDEDYLSFIATQEELTDIIQSLSGVKTTVFEIGRVGLENPDEERRDDENRYYQVKTFTMVVERKS